MGTRYEYWAGIVLTLGLALLLPEPAAADWNYQVVHKFTGGGEGYGPIGGLILASDGQLYGTTCHGGNGSDNGTVFRLETDGSVTTLHTFAGDDGICPQGIMQASDGNLYGASYFPTRFFMMDLSGNFSVLYRAVSNECTNPTGSLVEATDGFLYGLCFTGGAFGGGSFVRIDPAGNFNLIRSFSSPDIYAPFGTLLQAADGSFFATSAEGGPTGHGNVFQLTTAGDVTILHTFTGPDGWAPFAGLLLGADGRLYGTTRFGGLQGGGTFFGLDQDGGNFASLHSFDTTSAAGSQPSSELIQLGDGLFYGTTGTAVVQIDGSGTVAVLQGGLSNDTGGWQGPLLALDDNTLFGTESRGGSGNFGDIFELTRQ